MDPPPGISTTPWNKGKLIGQKCPLKLKEIWAIRIRLQLSHNVRDLAAATTDGYARAPRQSNGFC
jgi:hypothetical protein